MDSLKIGSLAGMLVGSVWLVGCASHPALPPVPDERMAEAGGTSLETLNRGHRVYLSQCGRCHEHQMPADVSRADWHVVVPGMAWNAGISRADEAAVLKYVVAAAKRP